MRKKKNNIGTVIVAILLCFIVISVISAIAPWLFLVLLIVVVGISVSKVSDARKGADGKTPSQTIPSPLSAAVNNDIRIMQDCVSILNTSENLQTVIRRYDDLLVVLGRLCEYEKNPAVSFPRELPSTVLKRMESEKPQIMNRAIQRAYDGMLRKCAALKTAKGRKNRQMKFFDEINDLMPYFSEETRDFAINFINQNINDPLTELEGRNIR